jgi:hypothetical protein
MACCYLLRPWARVLHRLYRPCYAVVEQRWWHQGLVSWSLCTLQQPSGSRERDVAGQICLRSRRRIPVGPPSIRPHSYTDVAANYHLGLRRSGLPLGNTLEAGYLSSSDQEGVAPRL